MKRFPALLIITLSAAVQAFGIYNVHALADVTEGGVIEIQTHSFDRLRKKLAVDLIQTVRGLGYLVDPNQPAPRV